MEKEFWLERWQKGHIGFHAPEPNQFLVKHFEKLKLQQGSTVFVPLCGKSVDMHWLLSHGYNVVGVEFAELAIRELFQELGVQPKVTQTKDHLEFKFDNITIFTGDIFHLDAEMIGSVDAVYDRASLVALPAEMRIKYTSQLAKITRQAPQLLVVYHYDQNQMQGPPFSVSPEEVESHYKAIYEIGQIESHTLPGGFRGEVAASEDTYLLK